MPCHSLSAARAANAARRGVLPRTRLCVALSLALPLVVAVWPAASVQAQAAPAARTVSFNVPAGPLGAALGAFGMQAGVMVASDPALTQGARTDGVSAPIPWMRRLRACWQGPDCRPWRAARAAIDCGRRGRARRRRWRR